MADDVKDIAVYTGSEWTSLSELAAGVVDCTLPIESVDATVKVDGNASVFTVSTGGEESFKVDSIGHVAINAKDSSNSLPRSNTMLEVVSDATSPFSLILDASKAIGVYEGRSGIRQYGTGGNSTIFEYAIDNTNGTYMFSGGSSARSVIVSGDSVADILVKPNEYVRLTPQIQTSSVCGLADNDSTIALGGQATLKKGDGSEYVPTDSASIATKAYCDANAGGPSYDDTQIKSDLAAEASTRAAADNTLQANIDAKVWVGTTAQYNALSKNPTTLYCLTD